MTLQIVPGGNWLIEPSGLVDYTQRSYLTLPNSQTSQWTNANSDLMLEDDFEEYSELRRRTFQSQLTTTETDARPAIGVGVSLPQAADFNNFRATSRRFHSVGLNALRGIKVSIMISSSGVPRFDLLSPFQQILAKRSEIVRLRVGWFRFADITPFLQQLPNNRYVILPGREIHVRVDPNLWKAKYICDGVRLGDENAHAIIRTALHDLLPQEWTFNQSGRSSRILSDFLVHNESEQVADSRDKALRVLLAQDIIHTTMPGQMSGHMRTLVLAAEYLHDKTYRDYRDSVVISLAKQYKRLERQNPTKGHPELAILLRTISNGPPPSESSPMRWIRWYAQSQPGLSQSFKQSSSWTRVNYYSTPL